MVSASSNSAGPQPERAIGRRSFLTLSALSVVTGVSLVGCSRDSGQGGATSPQGNSSGQGSGAASGGQNKLVSLINTQAPGDNGPIDDMIAGLRKLGTDKGVQVRDTYVSDASNFESALRSVAQSGAAVVITNFDNMNGPMRAVAKQFPNTRFVHLYGDTSAEPLPNVLTVSYDYYLGCYLSGVLGAKAAPQGKVGYIGGTSDPGQIADYHAVSAGAQSVSSGASVPSAFVGSWQDPAKALQVATQMFSGGAEYIQMETAAGDNGIIKAAGQGANRIVTGGSLRQFDIDPKVVVAAVYLDFGRSLYQEAEKALADGFKGATVHSGLADGVVDLVISDKYLAQGPADIVARVKAAKPEIEAIKQKIISGALTVPYQTTM